MENFPEIETISIIATAKTLALRALHFIGDSVRHEGVSEHFATDPFLDVPDHTGELPSHQDFEYRPKGW